MKIALFGINNGICADPSVMKNVSVAAEQAGFESLWTAEHVVLPDPQAPPSPAPPLTPMIHPSTALAYIAGVTSTIKLGTGITLLAQRNALVLAKEMAGVDCLSGGRLMLGVGAGYLKAEFDALGVEFTERGARTEEYIHAMRELWTSDNPAFEGRFVNFKGIQSRPRPIQKGGPPIVMGGASPAAFRRAIELSQGWYGFAMDVQTAASSINGLKTAASKFERPEALGRLEISITPPVPITASLVSEYADLGVDRLILLPAGRSEADLLASIEKTSVEFI
jgi:probable F420-dependent oxidoreductase